MNSMKNNLRTFLRLCCAIIAAFFISLSASAADVFVDQNATGLNNGTTWVDAYIDLQDGLGDADAGETVFVAKGTYKPGVVQAASFDIPLEVQMQGGYAGSNNPLNPFDRDFVLYETILSGDIDNNDLSSPAQEPSHIQGDNSYHVVTIIDDDALPPGFVGTEVDGFTITAGNALHIGIG